jgi:hypothetical protein
LRIGGKLKSFVFRFARSAPIRVDSRRFASRCACGSERVFLTRISRIFADQTNSKGLFSASLDPLLFALIRVDPRRDALAVRREFF